VIAHAGGRAPGRTIRTLVPVMCRPSTSAAERSPSDAHLSALRPSSRVGRRDSIPRCPGCARMDARAHAEGLSFAYTPKGQAPRLMDGLIMASTSTGCTRHSRGPARYATRWPWAIHLRSVRTLTCVRAAAWASDSYVFGAIGCSFGSSSLYLSKRRNPLEVDTCPPTILGYRSERWRTAQGSGGRPPSWCNSWYGPRTFEQPPSPLAVDALTNAIALRPPRGVVLHSARGRQFRSHAPPTSESRSRPVAAADGEVGIAELPAALGTGGTFAVILAPTSSD